MNLIKSNSPIALVSSGGGAKGAHSVGMWQAILESQPDIYDRAKMIIGTSTGALISALMGLSIVTKDKGYFYDLVHIYKNVEQGNIMTPRDTIAEKIGGMEGLLVSSLIYGRSSLYNLDPLEKLIQDHMEPHWQKLIDAEQEIGFCCTNLRSGKTELFTNKSHPNPEILKAALLASTSQPVIMGPVEVGDVEYVDGGLIDFLPVRFAKMDAICVSTQKLDVSHQAGSYDSTLTQLTRSLEIMTEAAYQNNRYAAESLACQFGYKYQWLEPSDPIEGDGLKFEPVKMREWLARGFIDGLEQWRNEV